MCTEWPKILTKITYLTFCASSTKVKRNWKYSYTGDWSKKSEITRSEFELKTFNYI